MEEPDIHVVQQARIAFERPPGEAAGLSDGLYIGLQSFRPEPVVVVLLIVGHYHEDWRGIFRRIWVILEHLFQQREGQLRE